MPEQVQGDNLLNAALTATLLHFFNAISSAVGNLSDKNASHFELPSGCAISNSQTIEYAFSPRDIFATTANIGPFGEEVFAVGPR